MLDSLGNLIRTHYCGELRAADADRPPRWVVLMGWVHRRRDLGNLVFIDLRDRAGIAQIVFNKELHPAAHAKAEELRAEYVVAVEGRVVRRQKANPELPTGEIEIMASALHILNAAKTPPFVVEDEISATEETRLRYRYLDLRRTRPARNLALRHRVILEIRKALDEMGFYEIETPVLTRSTPEGARDYLVPSRVHHGQFYALPQSPQIFKQILMISGMDRYFQIARCFRDEDFRADRQAEFTQLDLEMSFPRRDDIFEVIERVMVRACAAAGIAAKRPFPRMEYREVVRRYGSDKPDLRFGMELQDVTSIFEPAREALHIEGNIFALAAPGAAAFSRKQLDELVERAKSFGARSLYTVKVASEGITSPLEKILGASTVRKLAEAVGAKAGDLVVAIAAKEQIKGTEAAALIAGQLRLHLAELLKLIPKDRWEFVWLTGFPLFEWSETEKRWVPAQHPFTGIVEEDLDKLEDTSDEARSSIRSKGYDLVLNGVELGSGSIRIHRQDVQARVFRALGLTEEQARQRFGFFLDALAYGTPPHGGIALGLDRVVALFAGEKSIREVIAFPKTTAAQDLMADAPSGVDAPAVEELELMAAFAQLNPDCWQLARLTDRLLRFVDEEVFDRGDINYQTNFQLVLLLFLTHAHGTARAAVRLSKSGYGRQAAVLARTLFEAAVNVLWISKQSVARTSGFAELGDRAGKLLERARRHGWPALSEELQANLQTQLQEVLGEGLKEKRSSLRDKAIEVGLLLHYDWFYMLQSELAHAEFGGLLSYFRGPSTSQVHVGPGNEWVLESLASTFSYFYLVLEQFLTAFPQYDSAIPRSVYEEFQAYTKKWGNRPGAVS